MAKIACRALDTSLAAFILALMDNICTHTHLRLL